MKPRRSLFLLQATVVASAVIMSCTQSTLASSFTWDANGGSSGVTDGAGTWNTTAGNTVWWDGATNSIWSNTGPNDAIFGNFNGAAGTVAIGTAITVGNLTFNPAGSGKYTLSGAANTAANTLTLSGAAPTITTNQSATISALVSSTNGFVKEGLGSLTLTGSPADGTVNTIGGTITVNAGQLVVDGGTNTFGGDGAFQSNVTLANFGRFSHSGTNTIGNSVQITVGANAFALLNSGDSIGAFAGSGRVSFAGTLVLSTGTKDFTGALSGAGGLTINGAVQTLSGANLFTGTTTATTGSLALNNVNALQNSTLSKGTGAVTFTVAGTNTYNLGGLSGASALNIGGNSISVGGNNANTAYSASIGFGSAAGGLTKVGTGTLTLSGASIYTGATTVSRGTLELTGAGSLATSGITFNGTSGFTYTGSGTGSSDSVGALTRSAGNGTVTSTYGTSGNVALTFTSLATRTAGATANFVVTGGSNGTTNKIVLTGATANAFIDQGTFFGGSNFAWYDTGGFVRAINYDGVEGVTTAGGLSLASTAHQETTAAVTAQDDATFTTLKITGAHAITLVAAKTVTVNGILKTGATATLSGGSGIQAASGQDLVVSTDISTDALSINTPIKANGTNALVKTGAGDLTLGSLAVNTYTGGTFINQGKLIVNQDNNLGSTAAANNIRLNGGTLQPSANISLNANHGIDVNAGGGTINGNAFQLTLGSANMLSGSGPLTIAGSGSANSVLNSGATQDYSGSMTISSGRIVLNAGNITNPYGTGDITIASGANIYLNNTGSTWANRLFIAGSGESSRGAIRAQGGGIFNGDIILTNNATISSDGNGSVTTLNGNISGAFTLTLNGTGSATTTSKVILTGNNVHNATTVGLGITNIDHDIALGAYNGTVTINGSATLQAGAADIILNPDRTVAMSTVPGGTHNIDTQAFNMTIQGVITGASTEILNKQGAGKLTLTGTNTHTGVTGISAGTLNVASLSDYGVASSIGARAAVSETATGDGIGLRIGAVTTGATLQYTGSTAQSTNRQIRISAATNTIDASGTGDGTLSFTYSGANTNLYDTSGDRTLVLTGSNSGNNTFAISLTDQLVGSGNLTTLTKTGNGKWVLTGASSHTGGTNINGGILSLSGSGTTGATTGAVAMGGGQLDLGGLSSTVGAVSITSAYASGDTITNGDITGSSYAPSLATGTATISANLLGAAATFTKTGAGIVKLTGANTYGGTTTLTTGTIQIGAGNVGSVGAITSSAIGTGTLNLNGGTFSSDSATPRAILNAVTYSTASTFGDVTNNGKLTFSADVNLGTAQKTMTVNSDVQFDGILSGVLGGISLGTSTGYGKLTLTNNSNSFTGAVGFGANSGTLRITSSGALGVGPKTVTNTGASGLVPVTGANLLELDSNGGADISLAGNISFTTSGAAGVILNTAGDNTIAGDFNMTVGNGSTKIISNGGTLELTGTFTGNAADRHLELAGSTSGNIFSGALVNGSGNTTWLTKSGAGTWTVSGGLNTFTGNTKVNGGTLKLANNLAIKNSVFDTSGAGTLDTQGVTTPTFGGLTAGGNLVLHSNVTSLTLNVGGTQTYSGSLSGGTGLALAKSGAGTQILSNSNSYSGATSITGGILQVAHNDALGTTSGVTMTANNSLQLANGITVTGRTITLTGFGSGARGALQVAASSSAEWAGPVLLGSGDSRVGALGNGILTISGAIGDDTGNTFIVSGQDAASATPGKVIVSGTSNTYTGQTQVFRGILAIGADNALPTGSVLNVHAASGVADTAVFDLNNFNQQVAGLTRGNTSGPAAVTNTGASSRTLTINNSSNYAFDSAITGNLALVKSAAGNQTLSGTSTFTGGTRIDAGTLTLGHATNTLRDDGAVNVNGGELALGTNTDTVGAVTLTSGSITGSGAGKLTGTGSNFDVRSGNVSAKLGGIVGLDKTTDGVVTLSGANTYSGATTVTGGTLTVSGTGSLAAGSSVTVENLATLSVAGTVNGLLTVDDGGTLTGNGGTFNSSVTIDGIHSPGASPGLQTFTNGLTYSSTATLNAEFVGNTLGLRGTDFDGVDVTGGNLSIDSLATLNLLTSGIDYTLAAWDISRNFTVIDHGGAGTSTGLFVLNTSGAGSFGSEGSWSLANTSNDIVLSWTPVPEPRAAILGLLGTLALLRRRR